MGTQMYNLCIHLGPVVFKSCKYISGKSLMPSCIITYTYGTYILASEVQF